MQNRRDVETPNPARQQVGAVVGVAVAACLIALGVLMLAREPQRTDGARDGLVVIAGPDRSLAPAAPGTARVDGPAPPTSVDPIAPAPLPAIVSVEELHRRVATEPRDTVWAAQSETALRAALSRSDLRGLPVTVLCASRLCEISGSIPVDASEAAQNAAMLALQSEATTATIEQSGLADVASSTIENDPSDPRRILFRRYVTR